ncbi:InlB B-repeat-containing protein [Candidatus Saccharibacteria bacterium]|nr:InlB B-repeat-containing protein [Candidatus Saccharibacteria bacterium]
MINKLNFSTSDYHRKLQTSVLLLLLSCLAFVFIPYIVADANAETAAAQLDWSKITLELDTGSNSGNVAFNNGNAIVPDETGKLAAQSKTLTINTTGKHFNVYLSMDSSVGENQKLCFDFDASVSEKSACAHTGIGISPVSEDNDSPAKFSGNAWGYALNDGEPGFSTAGTYSNASLSGDVIASTTTNSADLALYNAKWAAVPSFGSEDLIWSGNTLNPNGFGTNTVNGSPVTGDTNNTKTVIYGVQVNNDLVAGTYGSKILYTAVASASDLNSPSTNVMSSLVYGGPTDITTLYMDIDAEGANIKERDITISLIKHSDTKLADSNNDGNFTMSELQTAKTAAVASCPVVAHSLEMENGKSLQFKCVLPDLGLNEGVDYDYIVEVPINGSLTKNYISYNTDGNDEGVTRYVGLQTLNSNDEPYVDTMQGITAGICSMTNTWGTGSGENALIYDRTGTGIAKANSSPASAAIGVGTFLLEDVRDEKTYLVRRLADGNCWMVQNLDYDLTDSDNRNLVPSTTDVKEEKTLSSKNLLAEIGSSCSEQYQSRGTFGTSCLWGSLKDESGSTITSAENNSRSAFARSYNYDLGYLTGNSNVNDPTGCAAIEGNSGVWDSKCQMPGAIGNVSSGTNDGTTQDSTWQPEYISNSTGSTFTMRGSMYYGDYYNWYAATAESGKWDMEGTATATESICPRGWQLPVNGDSSVDKSWQKLIMGVYGYSTAAGYNQNNRAAINKVMSLPLSVPFAGRYEWSNGALNYRGYDGYYWSSTATSSDSGTYAYNLRMTYGGYLNPQVDYDKTYGFTVRCVARDTESTTVEEEEEEAVACEAGKICYDGNGGTGTMSDQTASASSNVMLTAPTYNKLGYAFVGWNTQENGFGTTYQANETITTPSTLGSAGLQLYAKWLPSAGEMQNWSGCSTLGEHQTVALTDNRDNKTYAVRKLKDGNCWMVNNLNLELANFAGTNNLTSDNTDLSTSRTDLTDLGNGKKAWDPSASTIAKYQSGETFSDFTLRVLGQSQPAQFQSEDQTGYWWGSKKSDDGNYTDLDSVTNNANAEIPRSYNAYEEGFYNWYAATAESGTYSMSNASVSDSICPKGWQLPINGNVNKSYYRLIETTYQISSASQLSNNPLSIVKGGFYDYVTGNYAGIRRSGSYWTSTAFTNNSAYNLYFINDETVGTTASGHKPYGNSVRCVNRD